ncbi:MAG: type 1 periplasmic-binding domain-containing protein [Candidatus Dormibacteria bacterium]
MTNLSRRTPPLLMGVAALALMLSVFPSVLHTPLNGPGSTAEIAPVPGQGQAPSNLSQGGVAGSGSVGSAGGAVAGGGSPSGPSSASTQTPSGNNSIGVGNSCVGDPARQTEDPLSPPCRTWTGTDNGGATAPGVSRDYITVALYSDGGLTGVDDTKTAYQSSDTPFRHTAKALIKYFQSRYETYGRTVDLVELAPSSGATGAAQMGAFASVDVPMNYAARPDYEQALAARGIFSFYGWSAFNAGSGNYYSRAFLAGSAPYIHVIEPDADTTETMTAQWICRQLVGNKAVHAGDPKLAGAVRKFGLLYDDFPALQNAAGMINADLQRTCGLNLGNDLISSGYGASTTGPGQITQQQNDYQVALSKLARDGVTSVILETNAQGSNDPLFTAADSASPRYAPEWLFNSDIAQSSPVPARNAKPDQWADSIGITWRWRAPQPAETYWQRAYSSVNPDGQFDVSFGPTLYELLMRLYSGIQMAGPDLTPQTFEAGLESYRRTPSVGNFSPTAGYSPGTYGFVQDMTLIRWDPTGTPPGSQSTGCYLELDGGSRYGLGEWPAGDHSTDSGSCGADWETIVDIQPDVETRS